MYTYGLTISLLAACWMAAGCTGDDDRAPNTRAASTPGDRANAEVAGNRRDACDLLTAEEVAAVHGSPVEIRPPEDEGPYRSSCVYGVPGSDWDVMWITVHWRGGKEEWATQQTGRGIAVEMMAGEANDSITRPDPLSGIGDAAYYGGLLPSLVLEGDVLLEFMMPLLQNDREHFPTLAKKAVSRL